MCKQAREFLLCPEMHPLHSRSLRKICEIQLLQEPAEVPSSCEIRHVQIATTIFHKLKFQNEWMYVTNKEILFTTCDSDKESSTHLIEGVGLIKLNETCKSYTPRDILIPGKTDYRTEIKNVIPNSIIKERRNYESNERKMEDHHVKTITMNDLNEISNTNAQIEERRKITNKMNKRKEKHFS